MEQKVVEKQRPVFSANNFLASVAQVATPQLTKAIKLITTPDELQEAVVEITSQSVIAVDCEGIDLSRAGKLCVIQVATEEQVFVIDVCAFPKDNSDLRRALQSGLQFLEDSSILKIMFDPRGDSDALYHQIGITLNTVFDVQIAEVLFVKTCEPLGYKYRFRPNLTTCLEKRLGRHAITTGRANAAYFMKSGGHQMWDIRPLPENMLSYAAQDVLGCLGVASILARGFLNSLSSNSVAIISDRLWRASQTATTTFRDSYTAVKQSKALANLPNI